MATVGIIEKSPIVLRVLSELLWHDRRFEVAITASDLDQYLSVKAASPELLISGWVGRCGGGREVLRRAAGSTESKSKVVIYTGAPVGSVASAAIIAGARAVICKSTPPDRLLDALWAVSLGRRVFPATSPERPFEQLTRREMQVLNCVSEGQSNGRISKSLNISESTTKFHLRNIFEKLGVQNRTQAVARTFDADFGHAA